MIFSLLAPSESDEEDLPFGMHDAIKIQSKCSFHFEFFVSFQSFKEGGPSPLRLIFKGPSFSFIFILNFLYAVAPSIEDCFTGGRVKNLQN